MLKSYFHTHDPCKNESRRLDIPAKKNLHKSFRLVVAVLKRVPWKGNIMNLDSKQLLCSAALGSLISHFHSFFLACMLLFVQVSHLENALSALDNAIKQLSPKFGFD